MFRSLGPRCQPPSFDEAQTAGARILHSDGSEFIYMASEVHRGWQIAVISVASGLCPWCVVFVRPTPISPCSWPANHNLFPSIITITRQDTITILSTLPTSCKRPTTTPTAPLVMIS